jgi:hypothetical protein
MRSYSTVLATFRLGRRHERTLSTQDASHGANRAKYQLVLSMFPGSFDAIALGDCDGNDQVLSCDYVVLHAMRFLIQQPRAHRSSLSSPDVLQHYILHKEL